MKIELEMLLPIALSGAEAARSIHGSPFGAYTRDELSESAKADLHALRQGFSPPTDPEGAFERLIGGLENLKR